MKKIISNIAKIDDWVDKAPDPVTFQNNDDFMNFVVELMNYCLYLLKVSVALAPTPSIAHNGFSKNTAIIVGHMVRITKLYEGFLIHISKGQAELALIFFRLIFETSIRMSYMIGSKSKRKTFHSFILTSYKPEKEILEDLYEKKENRPLINIEKRMIRKIESRMQEDGISTQELMNNKTWNVDGKNARELLKALGNEKQYAYAFSNGSHFVHGDWCEINLHHVDKKGRFYIPQLNYTTPDPRIACSVNTQCLKTLIEYLVWRKSDPDKVVFPVVQKLLELNGKIDSAHENTLGA